MNEELRSMWIDAWNFMVKYQSMGNSAADWTRCYSELHEICVKHNTDQFCVDLFMAIYAKLERDRITKPDFVDPETEQIRFV